MDAVSRAPRPLIHGEGTDAAAWAAWPALARLPVRSAAQLVPPGQRAVIVAPHPDDEVLACGGLLHAIARLPRRILLVAVSNGEGSHPGSARYAADALARLRVRESARALSRLGAHAAQVDYLQLPDGQLAAHETTLQAHLRERLAGSDVVFCTWAHDGHPDHEAAARAARAACGSVGARLYGAPVWAWHWARPGDPRVPWHTAFGVPLDAAAMAAKRAALHEFRSQLEPDPSTGAAPVLPARALARWLQPAEVFFA